jgi:hypothetical protein
MPIQSPAGGLGQMGPTWGKTLIRSERRLSSVGAVTSTSCAASGSAAEEGCGVGLDATSRWHTIQHRLRLQTVFVLALTIRKSPTRCPRDVLVALGSLTDQVRLSTTVAESA